MEQETDSNLFYDVTLSSESRSWVAAKWNVLMIRTGTEKQGKASKYPERSVNMIPLLR